MVGILSGPALDSAIESTLRQMSEEQRDHFKVIMAALLPCYVNTGLHATILVGQTPAHGHTSLNHILTINASDIAASQLMDAAVQQMSTVVMADAPPRGMFN